MFVAYSLEWKAGECTGPPSSTPTHRRLVSLLLGLESPIPITCTWVKLTKWLHDFSLSALDLYNSRHTKVSRDEGKYILKKTSLEPKGQKLQIKPVDGCCSLKIKGKSGQNCSLKGWLHVVWENMYKWNAARRRWNTHPFYCINEEFRNSFHLKWLAGLEQKLPLNPSSLQPTGFGVW